MAELRYEIDSDFHATITLEGEIVAGDPERFEQFARVVCKKHLDPEMPSITASLDSPGGDYLEGIALGNTFRRNGFGTLVRADAECYSAAAFAFLGGAFLGAVGGWGPDRSVEAGAKIGFHSFYSLSSNSVTIGEGIEQGKRLAMILTDYATALRVDMIFIADTLQHGPNEFLMLQTVEHFRNLKVKVLGLPRTRSLTAKGAIAVANYATGWQRPVSLIPSGSESPAVVRELTAHEYRKRVLEHLVEPEYNRGPMTELIRTRIEDSTPTGLKELYDDAHRLNAVPFASVADDVRIFHVRGFEYGALFYVTDCYVIPSNEGSTDLGLSVIAVHFQNHFEFLSYTRNGDILYEVHPPATVLWTT